MMTNPTEKSRRIYYTMGEVAEMFDVNASLIRFWEQKFDILKPAKNKKGNRLFTPKDIENLKLIYHLVKENGMTLAGARKRLKENREGVERNLEIIEKLQGVRALLLEVKQELKITDNQTEILVETPFPAESYIAPPEPFIQAEPSAPGPMEADEATPADTSFPEPVEHPMMAEPDVTPGVPTRESEGETEIMEDDFAHTPFSAEKPRMQIIEQTLF